MDLQELTKFEQTVCQIFELTNHSSVRHKPITNPSKNLQTLMDLDGTERKSLTRLMVNQERTKKEPKMH
jgi:hypothetical protein